MIQSALVEGVLVGLLSGLVGVFVVLRKRAFFTVALTHATFPGAVLATMLGINLLVGTTVVALALVALMALLARLPGQGPEVASGAVLTSGFALGAVLVTANPSQPFQIESYLTGSILTVSTEDLLAALVVLVVAVLVFALGGAAIVADTFDAQQYRVRGGRGWLVEVGVLALIAATVVVVMPAVGSILAIALIVGPALAAMQLTARIEHLLWAAPVLGVASTTLGIALSVWGGISAGASIVLVAAALVVAFRVGRLASERFAPRSERIGA